MSKSPNSAPEPDQQLSFIDDAGPEVFGSRTYDFSAVDSFPSAEAAHEHNQQRAVERIELVGGSKASAEAGWAAASEKSQPQPARPARPRPTKREYSSRTGWRRDPDYGAEHPDLR